VNQPPLLELWRRRYLVVVVAIVGVGGGWLVGRQVPPLYQSDISIQFTGDPGLAGQVMVVWASIDALLQRDDFISDVGRAVGSPLRASAEIGGPDTILISVQGDDAAAVSRATRLTAERVNAALADSRMRASIDREVNRRVPAPVLAEVQKWYDVSPHIAGDASSPQPRRPRFMLAGLLSALGVAVFGLAVASAISARLKVW
jgi:hypothetical protein